MNPKYEVGDDFEDFNGMKTTRRAVSSDLARAEQIDDTEQPRPKRSVLGSKSTNHPPRPRPSTSTKTRPDVALLPPRISRVAITSLSAPKAKVSRASKSNAGQGSSENRTHATDAVDTLGPPRKSPKRSANTSTSAPRMIVSTGDVDRVIDTRPPPTTSSSPTAWLKEKAAGVKRAACKLLGHHIYEPLDEGPASKKRKDSDLDLDSFGEPVCSLNVLPREQDELTLPAGSYVVTYRGPDTVVDNAHGYFGDPEEMEGIMNTPPAAQSTPRIGWRSLVKGQGKTRKTFSIILENEDEGSLPADLELPTVRKIQVVRNAPSGHCVEDVPSDKLEIRSKHTREKPKTSDIKAGDNSRYESAMEPPAKIGSARRIVRKAGLANLRGGGGTERGYGSKVSKVSGEGHGATWDSAVDFGVAKRT